MKKTILLLALFVALAAATNAQTKKDNTASKKEKNHTKKKVAKSEAPTEVIKTFEVYYPGVEVTDWYSYPFYWDIENDEPETDTLWVEYFYPEFYEVEFIEKGKKHKGIFSRKGKHVRTTSKAELLPAAVDNAIKSGDYKDWTVAGDKEKVEKKETNETLYKVAFKKGKERHVVYYDENGKIAQVKKIKL